MGIGYSKLKFQRKKKKSNRLVQTGCPKGRRPQGGGGTCNGQLAAMVNVKENEGKKQHLISKGKYRRNTVRNCRVCPKAEMHLM